MKTKLYALFKKAIESLPPGDLPRALHRAEHVADQAVRDHGMDALFPRRVENGHPADRLLHVFDGHTVGEVADVMAQLRGELADELARSGAPADAVRELREGGIRP